MNELESTVPLNPEPPEAPVAVQVSLVTGMAVPPGGVSVIDTARTLMRRDWPGLMLACSKRTCDGFVDATVLALTLITEKLIDEGSVTATVRVPADLTWFFLGQWGRHARVTEKADDVNVVVVGDRSTASIARQLAGWADAIEVVEPPEVRAELVRIGEALVRRHVTAPVPS